MKTRTGLSITAIALTMVLAAGCATRGDIESLKTKISQLEASTQAALSNSEEAKKMATDSQAELTDIRSLANANNKLVQKNSKQMDTMFNKSLRK